MACFPGRCNRRGQYFLFPSQLMQFEDAARFCESRGYQLLTSFDRVAAHALFNCCDPRKITEQFWIGLRKSTDQRCQNKQTHYQWLGNRSCASGYPLLISQQNDKNCVGVALTRMRRFDSAIRASEFSCQKRLRFICYSGQRPTTSTSTVQSTAAVSTRVIDKNHWTFNSDRNFNSVVNTKLSGSSINASSASQSLLLKGAIGGASALLVLLILLAVVCFFFRKSEKTENVREMAKRKQNEEPASNAYYSFETGEENNECETRSKPCIRTTTLPVHVDPEMAHYIFPDSISLPSEEDSVSHEYVEIENYFTIAAADNDHIYACMTGASRNPEIEHANS